MIDPEEVNEISRIDLAFHFYKQENDLIPSINEQAERYNINEEQIIEDIATKIDLVLPNVYHNVRVRTRAELVNKPFLDIAKKDTYKGIESMNDLKFQYHENYQNEKNYFNYLKNTYNQQKKEK